MTESIKQHSRSMKASLKTESCLRILYTSRNPQTRYESTLEFLRSAADNNSHARIRPQVAIVLLLETESKHVKKISAQSTRYSNGCRRQIIRMPTSASVLWPVIANAGMDQNKATKEPQVLVIVSIYQGSILSTFFGPTPM